MEVNSYVQSYSAHNKSGGVDKVTFITLLVSFTGECFTNTCTLGNDFLAGHMLQSKLQYSALDETVVTGVACRHECPIPCFFSLKHGERSVVTLIVFIVLS